MNSEILAFANLPKFVFKGDYFKRQYKSKL
jgi:hypothetical protein